MRASPMFPVPSFREARNLFFHGAPEADSSAKGLGMTMFGDLHEFA